MNDKRVSFDDSPDEEPLNQNLKISNKKSKFAHQSSIKEKFEEAVEETSKSKEDLMQETLELGQKFLSILNDKTLPQNKGPLQKSLEKEILYSWQSYILRLNNDQSQPEGMGSTGAFSLIFSSLLKLRDRANIAEFKLKEITDDFQKVKDEIIKLKQSR